MKLELKLILETECHFHLLREIISIIITNFPRENKITPHQFGYKKSADAKKDVVENV